MRAVRFSGVVWGVQYAVVFTEQPCVAGGVLIDTAHSTLSLPQPLRPSRCRRWVLTLRRWACCTGQRQAAGGRLRTTAACLWGSAGELLHVLHEVRTLHAKLCAFGPPLFSAFHSTPLPLA